jgi:hypothetical protein
LYFVEICDSRNNHENCRFAICGKQFLCPPLDLLLNC